MEEINMGRKPKAKKRTPKNQEINLYCPHMDCNEKKPGKIYSFRLLYNLNLKKNYRTCVGCGKNYVSTEKL